MANKTTIETRIAKLVQVGNYAGVIDSPYILRIPRQKANLVDRAGKKYVSI